MKTVVIFGGSGFVGQNIVRRLAQKGYRIIIPYQKPVNEAKLRLFGDVGQIIPIKFRELSDEVIKSIIHESDIFFNLKTIWKEKQFNVSWKYFCSSCLSWFCIHVPDK